MDIQPLLAVLETASAQAQAVAELSRSCPEPQLQAAVEALREALRVAQGRCLALREDLEQLEEQLAACDQLTLEHGLYWRFIGDKKIAGPFCPKCYAERQALIKLHYHPGGVGRHAHNAYYECEQCGSRFPQ